MTEWATIVERAIKECREREQRIRTARKQLERLLELLPEVEQRPFALLSKLDELLEKLSDTLPQQPLQELQELRKWVNQRAKEQLANYTALLKETLPNADIKGRLSEGYWVNDFVEVRIDERKRQAKIGTRFHAQQLKGDISVVTVAEAIQAELKRLFERPFDPEAFLRDLFRAYLLALTADGRSGQIGTPVSLFSVHKFVTFLRQQDRLFQKGDGRHFQPYLPDEFTVDMGRLLERRHTELQGYWLHLHPVRNPKLFIVNFASKRGQNYGLMSFQPVR